MEIRRKRNAEEDLRNQRIGASDALALALRTVSAVFVAPNRTPLGGHSEKTRSDGSKRALILYLYPIVNRLIIPFHINRTLNDIEVWKSKDHSLSSEMFHPIFATVYPSVFVGGRIQTRVLIHSWVDEMLSHIKSTSVNFPLIPLSVVAGTVLIDKYAYFRACRCPELWFCKKPLRVWLRSRFTIEFCLMTLVIFLYLLSRILQSRKYKKKSYK